MRRQKHSQNQLYNIINTNVGQMLQRLNIYISYSKSHSTSSGSVHCAMYTKIEGRGENGGFWMEKEV